MKDMNINVQPVPVNVYALQFVPSFVSLLLITAISRECRLTAKQHDRPLRCEKIAKGPLIS
ncbi:MAG: hypothetical protein D3912_16025 [Candidatus Electrothrix sp. AX1]|nr:hypothetical protein [Candidatus Electrothrix sp. AX1]